MRIITSGLLVAALALAGCGGDDDDVDSTGGADPTVAPTTTVAEPASELDAARAQWDAAGISNYSFDFRESCFCPPIVWHITVEDGVVVASEPLEPDAIEPTFGMPTIETLFDAVEEASVDADYLEVTYDPDLGYPTSIDADPIENAVDDEYVYAVTNFTAN